MEEVRATLKIEEFVRFFEPGHHPVSKIEGQMLVEVANWNKIADAIQTFKILWAEVALPGRQDPITVRSAEFDHSPKHYIDGEIFPFERVREHFVPVFSEVKRPRFGIRTRCGSWVFEEEEPRVIRLTEEENACPNCGAVDAFTRATEDPLSDSQGTCANCGHEYRP